MSDPLSGLPQAPPPFEGHRTVAPRGHAPSSVQNAVRLMLLSALIGLIGLIVLFVTKDDFTKTVRDNSSTTVSASSISIAFYTAVAISAVILVLFVLLAFQVRHGRNWARIVTWVFSGIGLLGGVSSLAQSQTGLNKTFTVVGGLVDLAIIVLLALTPSNHYFKRRY